MSVLKDIFHGASSMERYKNKITSVDSQKIACTQENTYIEKVKNSQFANLLLEKILIFLRSAEGIHCLNNCNGISVYIREYEIYFVENKYLSSDTPDHAHNYSYKKMGYSDIGDLGFLNAFSAYIYQGVQSIQHELPSDCVISKLQTYTRPRYWDNNPAKGQKGIWTEYGFCISVPKEDKQVKLKNW